MGRKVSRLTEKRLVPFEAARHVAYPYDRPRTLHPVPLCGLTLISLDRPGHNRARTFLADRESSGNGRLPFWRLRRSPLLLRRGLQRGDVELHHLHHRSHRFGMLQDLANLLRHDLPAQAELVRQPAAGHRLATLKQVVPVAVALSLVLTLPGRP